jgi:hypothetical protein
MPVGVGVGHAGMRVVGLAGMTAGQSAMIAIFIGPGGRVLLDRSQGQGNAT